LLGRIILFFAGLLVVVLFTALIAPMFITWNDFRTQFEDQASRILGKKVVVNGDVQVRILPFPTVTLHDVQVGRDEDGNPLVQVANFSMDMELAPFLSGEARIVEMRIDQPRARIKLLADGTLDWMRGSHSSIPAKTVVLEKVFITDGEVAFVDEQTGRDRVISDINTEMSARSLAGPWRAEGDAVFDGHPSHFSFSSSAPDEKNGTIRVHTTIKPEAVPVTVETDGDLAIVDDRPRYDGQFTASMMAEVEDKAEDGQKSRNLPPRVKGKFELTNERVRIPEYRLEVGSLRDPYVVTGEATYDTGTKGDFFLKAEGQQIDVARLDTGPAQKTARPGTQRLSAAERLDALIGLARRIPVPSVPGRAEVKLPAIVAGDTTIRDVLLKVEPNGKGWTIDNAEATLPGRTKIEGNGKLTLVGSAVFDGHLTVASRQPSGVADWLTGSVAPEIRNLRTAGFSADVSLSPEVQNFDNLEVVTGGAAMKGRIGRVSLSGQVPALTVDLAGDRIDLDVLRALTSLMMGEDAGSGLLGHDIDAHLAADRLTAFGVEAQQVDAAFSLSNGALSVKTLDIGDIGGAKVSTSGEAEGSVAGVSGSGDVHFDVADAGRFLQLLQKSMPAHPVLGRLAENSSWFDDTALDVALSVGGGDRSGISADIRGTSNGSNVTARIGLKSMAALADHKGLSLDLTLTNPRSSILFGQLGFMPLPVGGLEDGRVRLVFNGADGEMGRTQVTFDAGSTHLAADGNVSLAAEDFLQGDLKLTLKSDDIEPYLILNGVALPGLGDGLPVDLTSSVSVASDTVTLDKLAGNVSGDAFSGMLRLKRGQPVLTIGGNLAFDSLDPYWLAETVYGPLYDVSTGGYTNAPFEPPMNSVADIDLTLKAGDVPVGLGEPVRSVTGTLTSRNGALNFEDLTGDLFGGKVSGHVRLANSNGTGSLQAGLELAGADATRLFWSRGGKPVIEGGLTGKVTVETSGATLSALARTLGGSGELDVAGAKINGLDLSILPTLLAANEQSTGDDISNESVAGEVLPLLLNGSSSVGDLKVPFSITNGRWRANNLSATTATAQLSGAADFDVQDRDMSGALQIAFATGKDDVAGANANLTLQYFGQLDQPQMKADVTGLTNYLSLRAFDRERRRVEHLQANVLEKQRLRREASLYQAMDERRAEEAKKQDAIRLEVEQHLKELADQEKKALDKRNAELEAAKRAAEAAAQNPQDNVPVFDVVPLQRAEPIIVQPPAAQTPPPAEPKAEAPTPKEEPAAGGGNLKLDSWLNLR
jgi:uncharacterized protein involved in outer membrane biogenesis